MRPHVRSLAKADFASLSQHVREGQRITALDAEADARQGVAVGAGGHRRPAAALAYSGKPD
jgi:hypothetical protein